MKLHELDATALLAALRKGETSSVEVVDALIARRRAVGDKVSAIVLPLDDSARKAAESADAARHKGEALGPLHGLPVTIKDNFEVIGTPATLGVESRRNHHSHKDAVTVAALKHAGCVVLGKTNVPQLLLVQESDNAIYGITKNPWNVGRSPGGSSGVGGVMRVPCFQFTSARRFVYAAQSSGQRQGASGARSRSHLRTVSPLA